MSTLKSNVNEILTSRQTDQFRSIGLIFFSFVAYYLAARLGLEVATLNKQASPVWPATGIGMSLIFFFGPRMAIGIFAGALLSNYGTGLNLPATFAIALGNSIESLFFVWAFNKGTSKQSGYGIHSRAILGIFLFVLAASISATVGSSALWVTSVISTQSVLKNWITWWIGDFLGALFLFPIAYRLKLVRLESVKISQSQLMRFLFCALLAAILGQFVFTSEVGKPYLFLIFVPLLLTANWFDSLWIYAVSLGVCVLAVFQTIHGNGPFAGNSVNDNLIHLQIFLAGLSVTAVGLGSLKQEGFHVRLNLALLFGWILSGMSFYFSYTSTAAKDETRFLSKVTQSKEAIESRMVDYIRVLESGVSFFNASEYVSQKEWYLFASKILSTNHYPGIEGIGVIFSSSIKTRFERVDAVAVQYQPKIQTHAVPNLSNENAVQEPEDKFVITYVEPRETNQAAIGLNISSEKHRYQAAIRARNTGRPTITEEVYLVQDRQTRPGFLIYVPIYKSGMETKDIEDRKKAFLGFVYAPVIFEKFLSSAMKQFGNEVNLFAPSLGKARIPASAELSTENTKPKELTDTIMLAGKQIEAIWKKGRGLESSLSLIASWIGFFGTITSLLLAVMLSSLQNLTTRAQSIADEMTKEVNERRRAWQALTETSPVGIYLTDKQGNCTYVNSKWSHMTGLSTEQASGSGWVGAIHPEDRELVSERWSQFIQGDKFECNYRYMKSDGEVTHVAGQAIPLKDEENRVTGYFGTVQDVTQLHQNQIALLTSSRMSSLGQMASGIAHEINNPLAIILGKAQYLDKVLEGTEHDKAQKQAKQIHGTVQRIVKIIRGLQAFARETSNEAFKSSSVKDMLSDTLELCRERFSHFQVRLLVPDDIDTELCFWGRSEQISQVLVNLLNNAFDAAIATTDKWVKIEVRAHLDQVQIVVSDSGLGISPSIQGRIFDPFFTTKEIGKGTGLGLSIAKGIVDRHEGKIYVDLTKAHTTFVFELRRSTKAPEIGVA